MNEPKSQSIDDLARECHSLIEALRRKRLGIKLLKVALDSLRTINGYKDPIAAPRRKPNQRGQPPIVVADLLRE